MKNLLLTIILLALTSTSFAQFKRGTITESIALESEILGKTVNYTIYLPFDYETSNRKYPITYLLHGYGDNDMGWMQFGEAHLIADELIAKREIPPMIIAMPDGGVSFYINNFDGTVKYEDFFMKEFIPHIESTYRIRAERRYRGIAGLSMGGFGTLNYALKYPEMFSGAYAMSAAIYSENSVLSMDKERWESWTARLFGPYPNNKPEKLSEHYRNNNAFDVTKEKGAEAYKQLRLTLDCGDDDFLVNDNHRLSIHLNEMGIKHEFRMRDGIHNWPYWRESLPTALKYLGESYHQF